MGSLHRPGRLFLPSTCLDLSKTRKPPGLAIGKKGSTVYNVTSNGTAVGFPPFSILYSVSGGGLGGQSFI